MSSANSLSPIITVDGPSGSGKGTVCQLVAQKMGWHLLDSGALYRLVALAASHHGVALDDHAALETLAEHLNVEFLADAQHDGVKVILEGEEVTKAIRAEEVGLSASKVAAIQGVRQALLNRQRAFAQSPGLVADGRDMGTVVFPDAPLKIYLDASAEERAQRRYKQLISKGVGASLQDILADIQARDDRDMNRAVAPLRPADDAIVLDSTYLSIEEVLTRVLDEIRKKGLR
ncbi:MAG: (d)CMP kinase [Pontibacterium sp.]